MGRTLSETIKDWELRNAVNVSTLQKAKQGQNVHPGTAYSIAIMCGCSDEEAKQYAEKAAKDSGKSSAA